MSVIDIDSFRELDRLIVDGKQIVVLFKAFWCQPCKQFYPHFQAAAGKSKRLFVQADIEKPGNAELLSRYNVLSVPTLISIDKDGYRVLESRNAQALLRELGE